MGMLSGPDPTDSLPSTGPEIHPPEGEDLSAEDIAALRAGYSLPISDLSFDADSSSVMLRTHVESGERPAGMAGLDLALQHMVQRGGGAPLFEVFPEEARALSAVASRLHEEGVVSVRAGVDEVLSRVDQVLFSSHLVSVDASRRRLRDDVEHVPVYSEPLSWQPDQRVPNPRQRAFLDQLRALLPFDLLSDPARVLSEESLAGWARYFFNRSRLHLENMEHLELEDARLRLDDIGFVRLVPREGPFASILPLLEHLLPAEISVASYSDRIQSCSSMALQVLRHRLPELDVHLNRVDRVPEDRLRRLSEQWGIALSSGEINLLFHYLNGRVPDEAALEKLLVRIFLNTGHLVRHMGRAVGGFSGVVVSLGDDLDAHSESLLGALLDEGNDYAPRFLVSEKRRPNSPTFDPNLFWSTHLISDLQRIDVPASELIHYSLLPSAEEEVEALDLDILWHDAVTIPDSISSRSQIRVDHSIGTPRYFVPGVDSSSHYQAGGEQELYLNEEEDRFYSLPFELRPEAFQLHHWMDESERSQAGLDEYVGHHVFVTEDPHETLDAFEATVKDLFEVARAALRRDVHRVTSVRHDVGSELDQLCLPPYKPVAVFEYFDSVVPEQIGFFRGLLRRWFGKTDLSESVYWPEWHPGLMGWTRSTSTFTGATLAEHDQFVAELRSGSHEEVSQRGPLFRKGLNLNYDDPRFKETPYVMAPAPPESDATFICVPVEARSLSKAQHKFCELVGDLNPFPHRPIDVDHLLSAVTLSTLAEGLNRPRGLNAGLSVEPIHFNRLAPAERREGRLLPGSSLLPFLRGLLPPELETRSLLACLSDPKRGMPEDIAYLLSEGVFDEHLLQNLSVVTTEALMAVYLPQLWGLPQDQLPLLVRIFSGDVDADDPDALALLLHVFQNHGAIRRRLGYQLPAEGRAGVLVIDSQSRSQFDDLSWQVVQRAMASSSYPDQPLLVRSLPSIEKGKGLPIDMVENKFREAFRAYCDLVQQYKRVEALDMPTDVYAGQVETAYETYNRWLLILAQHSDFSTAARLIESSLREAIQAWEDRPLEDYLRKMVYFRENKVHLMDEHVLELLVSSTKALIQVGFKAMAQGSWHELRFVNYFMAELQRYCVGAMSEEFGVAYDKLAYPDMNLAVLNDAMVSFQVMYCWLTGEDVYAEPDHWVPPIQGLNVYLSRYARTLGVEVAHPLVAHSPIGLFAKAARHLRANEMEQALETVGFMYNPEETAPYPVLYQMELPDSMNEPNDNAGYGFADFFRVYPMFNQLYLPLAVVGMQAVVSLGKQRKRTAEPLGDLLQRYETLAHGFELLLLELGDKAPYWSFLGELKAGHFDLEVREHTSAAAAHYARARRAVLDVPHFEAEAIRCTGILARGCYDQDAEAKKQALFELTESSSEGFPIEDAVEVLTLSLLTTHMADEALGLAQGADDSRPGTIPAGHWLNYYINPLQSLVGLHEMYTFLSANVTGEGEVSINDVLRRAISEVGERFDLEATAFSDLFPRGEWDLARLESRLEALNEQVVTFYRQSPRVDHVAGWYAPAALKFIGAALELNPHSSLLVEMKNDWETVLEDASAELEKTTEE
jgi:hypothetical protein